MKKLPFKIPVKYSKVTPNQNAERLRKRYPYTKETIDNPPNGWNEKLKDEVKELVYQSFKHYSGIDWDSLSRQRGLPKGETIPEDERRPIIEVAPAYLSASENGGEKFINDFFLKEREIELIKEENVVSVKNIFYRRDSEEPEKRILLAMNSFIVFDVKDDFDYRGIKIPKNSRVILFRKMMAQEGAVPPEENGALPFWNDIPELFHEIAEGLPENMNLIAASHFQDDSWEKVNKFRLTPNQKTNQGEYHDYTWFVKAIFASKGLAQKLSEVVRNLPFVPIGDFRKKFYVIVNSIALLHQMDPKWAVSVAIKEDKKGDSGFISFLLSKANV